MHHPPYFYRIVISALFILLLYMDHDVLLKMGRLSPEDAIPEASDAIVVARDVLPGAVGEPLKARMVGPDAWVVESVHPSSDHDFYVILVANHPPVIGR